MTRPLLLGLVADDLTGAADSAAGFAQHGWRVVLQLRAGGATAFAPDDLDPATPTVLALTTRCRALPDAQAAQATRRAVEAVSAAGAQRLYLKIDSTVRGSVAAQVEGALLGWEAAHAPVSAAICPAFPGLGRTVELGVVKVHGVPAERTAARTDPVTPLATSDLTRLFPTAVRGDVDHLGARRQVLLDASDDSALDVVALRASTAGPGVVMVGSGGLAAALGRCWSTSPRRPDVGTGGGRTLVAVSSLHPVTAGQVEHLRARLRTSDADVLTSAGHRETDPEQAADMLGRRVAVAMAEHSYRSLVLVGGDGAAAVLDRLGAVRIVVDGTVLDGCPTGVLQGGVADGVRVVTKSGGFGAASALAAIVDQLAADQGPPPGRRPLPRDPAAPPQPQPVAREGTP